jgi:hypothetical protein
MTYLFRQGVRALLKIANGVPNAQQEYAEWEEVLVKSVRAADRQAEENYLYPSQSIMGAYNPWCDPIQVGAGWPFGPMPWN